MHKLAKQTEINSQDGQRDLGDLQQVVGEMAQIVDVMAKKRAENGKLNESHAAGGRFGGLLEQAFDNQADRLEALISRIESLEGHLRGQTAPGISELAASLTNPGKKLSSNLQDASQVASDVHRLMQPETALAESEIAASNSMSDPDRRDLSIETVMQPIINRSNNQPVLFECFGLLSDTKGRLLKNCIVNSSSLPPDQARLFDEQIYPAALKFVRRLHMANRNLGMIVNLSREALEDAGFVQKFGCMIAQSTGSEKSLIVEIAQEDFPYVSNAITILNRLGVKLCMGKVSDWSIRPAHLHMRGFRYIKLRCKDLLTKAGPKTSRLLQYLNKVGLTPIVENIESIEDFKKIRTTKATLIQGHAIAAPRLVS